MWRESESEIVRLQRVFAHNGLTGESLLQKFRTASREDVRLAAALRGYYTPGCAGEAEKKQYLAYLCRRVRPTVQALMEENQVLELEDFEEKAGFTADMVDEFLQKAMELDRPEVIVWLLRRKQQRYGFRDRDSSF